MSELYSILKPENTYFDRKNYNSPEEYLAALDITTTLYVGNLSFFTTQDSVRELFALAGKVDDIIMGINDDGNPAGFCFVIFATHQEAGYAVEYVSKTKLNERIIRVDWDPGYKKGREKGRGSGGQQRRDDFRTKQDAQRPRKRTQYENRSQDHHHDRVDKRNNRYEGERDRQRNERGDRQDRHERYDRGDRGDQGERRDNGYSKGSYQKYPPKNEQRKKESHKKQQLKKIQQQVCDY